MKTITSRSKPFVDCCGLKFLRRTRSVDGKHFSESSRELNKKCGPNERKNLSTNVNLSVKFSNHEFAPEFQAENLQSNLFP